MRVGNVGGLRQPRQGMHAHDLVEVALTGLDLGPQRRRHHVGRPHAVDADAVPAEFDGQQLREAARWPPCPCCRPGSAAACGC